MELDFNVCNNRNGFGLLDKKLNYPNETSAATAAVAVVVQLLFEYKQNVECEIYDKLFSGSGEVRKSMCICVVSESNTHIINIVQTNIKQICVYHLSKRRKL